MRCIPVEDLCHNGIYLRQDESVDRGWVTTNIVLGQGFTSGEGNGTEGRDFLYGDLLLAGESSNGSTWLASWEEGTYVEGEVREKPVARSFWGLP